MDEEEALKALLEQQRLGMEATQQRLAALALAKAQIVVPGIASAGGGGGGSGNTPAALAEVPGTTKRYAKVGALGLPISRAGRELKLGGKAHRVEAAAASPLSPIRNHHTWHKFYDPQANLFLDKRRPEHKDRYVDLMRARLIPVDAGGIPPLYLDEATGQLLAEHKVYAKDGKLLPALAGRKVEHRIIVRDDAMLSVPVVLFAFYSSGQDAPKQRAAGERRVNPALPPRLKYLDRGRKYFIDMEGNYHQMWKELVLQVPSSVWHSSPVPPSVEWAYNHGGRAVTLEPVTWSDTSNDLSLFNVQPPVTEPKVWYLMNEEHGVPFLKPEVDVASLTSIFRCTANRTRYDFSRSFLDFVTTQSGVITAFAFGNATAVPLTQQWMGVDEPVRLEEAPRPFSKFFPLPWGSSETMDGWLKESKVVVDEEGTPVPPNACGYVVVLEQFLPYWSKLHANGKGTLLPKLTLKNLHSIFHGPSDVYGREVLEDGVAVTVEGIDEDYTITVSQLKKFFQLANEQNFFRRAG